MSESRNQQGEEERTHNPSYDAPMRLNVQIQDNQIAKHGVSLEKKVDSEGLIDQNVTP